MKLFEIAETAMKTGDMIVRRNPKSGCCYAMRYFPESKEFYVVDYRTGEKVHSNTLQAIRVNLTDDLFDDDYYLMPIRNSASMHMLDEVDEALFYACVKLISSGHNKSAIFKKLSATSMLKAYRE